MLKLDARKLAREKNLFRYSSALERADFDTVAAVLHEAEHDPVLAQMITEINMVYESETLRLSPSLNHSSNHHQKELLMTTIILPRRQNTMQRWLPITLAAACVSMLFIGALLMRPIRPGGNFEAGLQAGATGTPTAAASPTIVPTQLPTFTPTPVAAVGGVEPNALPPTVVPPAGQAAVGAAGTPVCGGVKIITQDTLVHAQPSNNSVTIGRIPLGTIAETLATGLAAEGDTSVPQTKWFFIKANVDGNSVQGWVSTDVAQPADPANPCPSGDAVFSIAMPTAIDANVVATIVPLSVFPAASLVPADIQPVFSAGTVPACSAIILNGASIQIVNQVDKPVTIYAAPLTINSNAAVVGELPAKAEATLLYQQYDRASDPIGALWYLIMTGGEGDKQVTGWISANSITAADSCKLLTTDAASTTAAVAPVELHAITGVAMTSSAQTGTCRVINLNTQPATVFAAPLTAGSNAPVVGTFPVQDDAVVIFQNYDQQSAPVGTLWYLVSVTGVNQPAITGWVSANSINSTSPCAPEQLVGVSLSSATVSAGQVDVVAVPSVTLSTPVAISAPSMCQITNTTGKAATMFAAPLTANSNAPAVGEFAAGSDALVILQNYDQKSDPIGALWYLITVNIGSDKQLTGWISANGINSSEGCTTNVTGVSVAVPANAQVQAEAVTAPVVSSDIAPVGICTVTVQQNESVQVFSGPSHKGDESLLVNNLPPNMPATVLYQQQNKDTGVTWYLILAVAKEGKEISGWVSSDSVKVIGNCPTIP